MKPETPDCVDRAVLWWVVLVSSCQVYPRLWHRKPYLEWQQQCRHKSVLTANQRIFFFVPLELCLNLSHQRMGSQSNSLPAQLASWCTQESKC